jgi:hypothetical protein
VTGRHSAGLGSLVLPPIRTPWVPPPQPPDVALLRRVLDGLRRLQADPPADLAVQSRVPWNEPQPAVGDLPPLETRVPGPPPMGDPAEEPMPQDPVDDAPVAPVPRPPHPPMPKRHPGVPGGPGFLGAVGMTMPAVDEHAPPYSVDKTHIVSIS